ncbi:X-ray repair cross-complementing protein 6 isoform X1 [Amia ocellicauda]|uniref:X-ray repair cross-complementing protein 6 isoform X1 n=1 Tax=Amia ocellicauda TaxID=2972642 RepID=UPI003463DE38
MAEWDAYYQHEDEEAEHDEGEESAVDYKFSGRDSLVFLVDASKEMFEKGEKDDLSPFDMTMQCVRSVYTSKIVSSERDLLALVFYGCAKHRNSVDFKHVYVYHELDCPGAQRVLDVDRLRGGQQGAQAVVDLLGRGVGPAVSLGEALWVCANLFSDVKLRLSHKRVMIFTNQDQPHGGDAHRDRLAHTKARDLKDTGVVVDLMHLQKPGGFDMSLFFCDIITPPEGEEAGQEMGLQLEASGKLEDLQRRVRAKELKKRAQSRMTLSLGDGVGVAVGVYVLVRGAVKPAAVRLARDSNEPVRTKTRLYHTHTGSLLLPSDTKRAQVYGSRKIVLEREETDEVRKFETPGLVLIGFKPLARLKMHQHIRPAHFIYPEEAQVTGSSTVFSALLRRCSDRGLFALCRYTPRRNCPPRFVAMVPQREELDDNKVQLMPPGFHLIFLPFADDVRTLDTPQKTPATPEQVDKMKEIVHKLRFKYRSDAFENPVLQQHYRNLEALALDLLQPDPIEDHTLPKVDMMDKRLGPLVQEFKELVYPPDYNPDSTKSTAAKRKAAEGAAGGEKRPRAEVPEDELRAHVEKGTLGKLTVPVLKEACRSLGVRTTGTKKQELIDALMQHYTH